MVVFNPIEAALRDLYSGKVAALVNQETELYQMTVDWPTYRRTHVVPRIKAVLRWRFMRRTNPKAYTVERVLRHLTGVDMRVVQRKGES